ncbi:MAG: hypothetical protein IJW29_09840 [Clostridia bacterium]|nr:hypothetical protein [Clostridia bacterium]MBQ9785790.1 hypothetical protein [Clostridia bacterium]
MFFGKSTLYSVPFWERLIGWYEQSVLRELINYIIDKYFTVHFHIYEHISIGPSSNDAARTLIFGIAIGIVIATVMVARTRTKLGGFLRRMIAEDCMAPERAKTLSELGEFRNSAVRHELSRGVTLRKYVKCCEEEAFLTELSAKQAVNETKTEEKKPKRSFWARVLSFFTGKAPDDFQVDFTKAHFYIPEDLKYRVEVRFEKKGSGWLPVVLSFVGAILFIILACRFLPDILQMMDNIINQMAPQA